MSDNKKDDVAFVKEVMKSELSRIIEDELTSAICDYLDQYKMFDDLNAVKNMSSIAKLERV